MPSALFDYQVAIVEWAVRKGRAAALADCGLGKTAMGLTWAENVARHADKPVRALVAMAQIAQAMPAQLSSTAQDLARGKPSEIDHLNGFIVRRGAELGVATPVNQAMQALVKLAETARDYG
jgi:hypothetical protein